MIQIKRKLLEEALDQLKAAQQDSYVQSTEMIINEIEVVLRQPAVINQVCDTEINKRDSQGFLADHNIERRV